MINWRKCFYVWIPVTIGIAFASCKNNSATDAPPVQPEFKQPVIRPLKWTAEKKINFSAIKNEPVKTVVESFDLNKLPARSFDTTTFNPVKYHFEEAKFDFDALPQKDLDIDKLPSRPLKFKTYVLPAPKLIRVGPLRLVNNKMSVFEMGEAQGLKGDTISRTLTDRDGFVWIATNRGLYRYDGESLWLFARLQGTRNAVCLLQDLQGQIWTGYLNGGIQIINPREGTAKTLDTAGGLSTKYISNMLIDDQQRIWVSAYGDGVDIINAKTQTVKWLSRKQGLSSEYASSITQDAHHNIWIGSNSTGLDFIDLKNRKIRYVDSLHGLQSNVVNAVLCDHSGKLWVSEVNGAISTIDFQKKTIQAIDEISNVNNITSNLFEDDQNRIWAGKNAYGVEVIDPEKQTRFYLRENDELSSRYISGIDQDRQGQMWLAESGKLNIIENRKIFMGRIEDIPTTSLAEDSKGLVWQASTLTGVNIIDRKTKIIRSLTAAQGLSCDTMMFLRVLRGQVFIGTFRGLEIIDPVKGTITHLGRKLGFNKTMRVLITDNKGNVWIGGDDDGIHIYDPKNKTVKHLGSAEGFPDGDIEDLCLDKAGHVWINTLQQGIAEFDPETSTVQYISDPAFANSDQRQLSPDSAGNVWVGAPNGLFKVSPSKKTLTSFAMQQGLIFGSVVSIVNNARHIYAATFKGVTVITPPELNAKNNKKWEFESYGAFYGANKLEEEVESDLVTKDGLYWSGDRGLIMLNLSKKDTLKRNAYITGINILDRPQYFTNHVPAGHGNKIWDKVEGQYNIPAGLHISYDQNLVQFQYGSLNLARHDTTWYKYRLIGADKNWSEATSATATLNYINMAPGNYTFEVSCLNYDNTWSKPAILSFTIDPPWWETWWAYILYVVLLAGSIWGFSYYRSLKLIKDKRVLEHKVHIRTEEVMQQKEEIEAQRDNLEKTLGELKSTQTQLIQSEKMASLGELTAGIAHEIQNPLNFVNNFSEVNTELIDEMQEEINKGNLEEVKAIAMDIKENQQKINQHGKRADFIVKGMLQHSRTSTGEKQPTKINSLADEFLKLSYHGLRAKDKSFNAEMVTHFAPDLPKINVVQQDIGRVLLNLFNNAFYAVNQKQKTVRADYKPEVTVTTTAENNQVVIKVKDNGIGIPDGIKEKIMQPFFTTKPTGEGTGLGLSLTYDMVVKGHGGSIDVNTKENEFTEFIVSLPLN